MPVWLTNFFRTISTKAFVLIVQHYGAQFITWLTQYLKNAKRATDQEIAHDNLEEVNSNPESTVEERAKAYEDYINSGRH